MHYPMRSGGWRCISQRIHHPLQPHFAHCSSLWWNRDLYLSLPMTCQGCDKSCRQAKGVCPCSIDGHDILDHWRLNWCPAGRFGTTTTPINAPSAPPYTPPADPHDRSKWPTLAVWTANLARAGETGVGDTIHRLLSRAGAQAIAMAFTRITGQACGCSDRQQRLNKLYPY